MIGVDPIQAELFFCSLGNDFCVFQSGLRTDFSVCRDLEATPGDSAVFEQNLGTLELYPRQSFVVDGKLLVLDSLAIVGVRARYCPCWRTLNRSWPLVTGSPRRALSSMIRPVASDGTGTCFDTSGVTVPVTTNSDVVGCSVAAASGNCSG